MIRSHDERSAAIAKAELKYLRSGAYGDVVKASVHGDRVFLFGLRKRLLAVYAVRWWRNRVDVFPDLEWDFARKPETSPQYPVTVESL